jgi:hypothetical protein
MSDPLLLLEQCCDYSTLALLLRRINFASQNQHVKEQKEHEYSTNNNKQRDDHSERLLLPSPELTRHCLSFLVVRPVVHAQVTAIACSSHDNQHPLQECLNEDESSWWLSARGSMQQGKGREWVDFQVGNTIKRLTAVSLKIPPLPAGPLSVAEFQVEYKEQASAPLSVRYWKVASPVYVTQNRTGFQRFQLPEPVDALLIRIVCLSNQIALSMQEIMEIARPLLQLGRDQTIWPEEHTSVGFFAIRFE